jgi:hypothetical protein
MNLVIQTTMLLLLVTKKTNKQLLIKAVYFCLLKAKGKGNWLGSCHLTSLVFFPSILQFLFPLFDILLTILRFQVLLSWVY